MKSSKLCCHTSFLLPDSRDNLRYAISRVSAQRLQAKIVFDGAQDAVVVDCGRDFLRLHHVSEEDGVDALGLFVAFGFVVGDHDQRALEGVIFREPGGGVKIQPGRQKVVEPVGRFPQALLGIEYWIVAVIVQVGAVEHVFRQGMLLRVGDEGANVGYESIVLVLCVYADYVMKSLGLDRMETQEGNMLAGVSPAAAGKKRR